MIPVMPRLLLPEYLLWNLRGKYYSIRDITGQKQRRGLNMKLVGSLSLELPPPSEQKRIVAKVDELMQLCDELEARKRRRDESRIALNASCLSAMTSPMKDEAAPDRTTRQKGRDTHKRAWQRIRENFDVLYDTPVTVAELRKTILQLAVQGRLVPQDSGDEPAKVLLKKVRKARDRSIEKGNMRRRALPPPLPPDEVPYEIPSSWEWTRLGAAFDVRDGTHDTPKYVSTGYPLVTSKNIYGGRLDLSDVKLISEADHRAICERSGVDRGDILFAMIGSIGNPVIVNIEPDFSIKNVALFKYFARDAAVPAYLRCYLDVVATDMRRESAGGVQSFVSLGYLRKYPIPLPPLAEQKRIVATVNELMKLCDGFESILAQSQHDADILISAMVHHLCGQKEVAA